MDITVVIVNYRVKLFLEQTLRSVEEATQGLDAEVIVVDNNSGDDSIDFVRQRFPQVTFIENTDNVGFARANNQAIMRAAGLFTLILNPDTIISRPCIEQCIEWMRGHERCGAIGVRMVDGNGVFLPESKRAFPTPWVSFCKIFGLSALFPRSRWFARYHLRYLDDRQPHRIDILAGAFMLCRTTLLQQVGGFDEDFFMYGEDIDLSYRMVLAGYENWFLPVEIIHYKGESTKKDSMRYVRVFYEAMLIFYRKHYPRMGVVFYPIVKLGVLVRASMAALKRLLKWPKRRAGGAHAAHARWVVLSDDPARVATAAGISTYGTSLPADGAASVLIDDGTHNYDAIIGIIASGSRKGLDFHIWSHRNQLIISPKMQQS
ncbi:MAG: glycosyltransferase family 2 protein [Muribaculaceae bacterium]|nr:glycosyltransferase family 2 protein [Muribaculaceae bacterium]